MEDVAFRNEKTRKNKNLHNMSKLNNIVMFACNEGGHFAQMMALRDLFGKYKSVLVTDNVRANKEMPALSKIDCISYVEGTAKLRIQNVGSKHNDSRWAYLSGYLHQFIECYKILKLHRPKIIISTGSNIAVPLFIYGKLMGCKLVFIETRAHVYAKSLTGTLIAGISDKVIVQWPEMLQLYKKADYYGTLV